MGLNKLNHNYNYALDVKNAQIENFANYSNISALENVANDMTVSGLSTFQEISETIVDSTISSNSLTINFLNGSLFYVATAPTANFNVIISNVPTTNLRSQTISIFVVQGATGYRPNIFQLNGQQQTIRWLGGITPTPTSSAGKIDIFNFSMIRRSNAWIVLGSSNLNL